MNKRLSLLEILDYIGASTSNSRTLVEGEEVLNAEHIIMCGKTSISQNTLDICALCLQSSALNAEPHQISGSLILENDIVKIKKMICSCKAGAGGKCKHITAVLIKLSRENLSELEVVSKTDLKCVWNTQRPGIREKYKAVPIKDMPCLKDKIEISPLSVDETEVLNFFIQALPESAIAKHRKGRNSNTVLVDNGKTSNTSRIFENILVNCAQSVVMMELASVNVANSLDCCAKLLENMFNDNQYEAIETQQSSSNWHNLRKYRVTGSRCYEIYTYGGGDWLNKSTKYFWPKSYSNKYVRHGLKFEENAISAFKLKTNFNVQRCGIIIPHNNPWLAYSPDGIVLDENLKPTALVEVKCLYDGASSSIEEILNQCKFISREEGHYALKKKHKYYGQIQMGMAVLNLEKCFFVLYASYDDTLKIIEVSYDYIFVKEMLKKIKFNFMNNMIHVLCENKM